MVFEPQGDNTNVSNVRVSHAIASHSSTPFLIRKPIYRIFMGQPKKLFKQSLQAFIS